MVRVRENVYGVERGKRFGTRTVIGVPFSRGPRRWGVVVQCDCGRIAVSDCATLAGGRGLSCWACKKRYVKHGGTCGAKKGNTEPLYYVWKGMLSRCDHKNSHRYPDYGGRGISVCQEWMEYSAFRGAMSAGYKPGLEIDRIDNNGNYEPGNCRWATRKEQTRNTRSNRMITAFGETKCLVDWLEDERCTLTRPQIAYRLRTGISGEDALTKKLKVGGNRKTVYRRDSNGCFIK